MKHLVRRGAAIFLLFCWAGFAQAAELRVDAGGQTPGAYTSLTEAVAAAEPGDTLILAGGVYQEPEETFPIEIDKPLTLVGEAGAVLDAPAFKAILSVTAPDVTIESVSFALRKWGVMGYADRLTLRDCTFELADSTYRTSSTGVWLAGVYDATITDCDFTGCGMCLAGPPLSERSKEMPVLTGLFEVGDDLGFFNTHTLSGNRINGKPLYYLVGQQDVTVPQDAGGVIAVDCENLSIENLDVSDSSMGIQVVHSRNVVVRDVLAERCGIFGIYLAYLDGGLVERVTCRQGNHGIDIRKAQSVVVTDCFTEHCEQGIFLAWGEDCIVDRCRMIQGGTGFWSSVGADNQITRCAIEGNENGIYLQNEQNAFVADNHITQNTVAGMRMLKSGGQCVGNQVEDNWTGFLIATGNQVTLWDNGFENNAAASLYIGGLDGGKIAGNRFSGEAGAYLELEGDILNTLIRENDFDGGLDRVVERMEAPLDLAHNSWAGP